MGQPRVVVGIDGSRTSYKALDVAIEEATLREMPLHIVVAWQLVSPAIATETPVVVEHIVRHNEQILERALDMLDVCHADRVTASGELVNGDPVSTLLTAAEGSVMLVIGSSGTSNRPEPYLGSTARELVHRAPCPVLVVPA